MVSAGVLRLPDHPSYRRSNQLWKSCALVKSDHFAVCVRKQSRPSTEEEKMLNYKMFGFVSSAFLG